MNMFLKIGYSCDDTNKHNKKAFHIQLSIKRNIQIPQLIMLLTTSKPHTCLFTEMNKTEFTAALVIVSSGEKKKNKCLYTNKILQSNKTWGKNPGYISKHG